MGLELENFSFMVVSYNAYSHPVTGVLHRKFLKHYRVEC